ncbi:N-acetyltransferase B complex non catalytic subunit-domain-containing protein [Biscogniauxia mediterranea]|nr:N-acetyltransferase B complex non catalytic subunit-domain-containing protein [Biscogniauxia mediterranea]
MAPPAPKVPPLPRPVRLKSSCDLQLESAFREERWADAANLAQKRFKSSKDCYYHAIEVAAKCQSDSIADQSAGLAEIEKLLKDPKATEDADALDLYEFACAELQPKYIEDIGALRSKIYRASPKDYALGLRCFDACVWNLDWKHAQEIAALMDKNFVKERKFLFRNILLSFLVATSSDAPENTRKLFSNLAKAHAEKALKLRTTAEKSQDQPPRAIHTDQEVQLWLDLRFIFSARSENIACFRQPQTSPLAFFEMGFYRSYQDILQYLETSEEWDMILQLGKQILGTSIEICQKEIAIIEKTQQEAANDPSQAEIPAEEIRVQALKRVREGRTVKESRYLAGCCEWGLWEAMVAAARSRPDSKSELKKVGKLLNKMLRVLQPLEHVQTVFQKNSALQDLKILFARDSGASVGDAISTRASHLAKHLESNCGDRSCFRVLKPLIAQLSRRELTAFLQVIENSSTNEKDKRKALMLTSEALRIRYLEATSATDDEPCNLCHLETRGADCMVCIRSIALSALDSFGTAVHDDGLVLNAADQENPLATLTMLGAVCLLKVAGAGNRSWGPGTNSPLFHIDLQLFLQAVLWLDYYEATQPRNPAVRLLLIKLLILMGCASKAKALWDKFDVKNAILPSLGSLFFDRLSTISPGEFNPGSSRTAVGPIKTFFINAMRRHTPTILMQAMENENYGSFIDELSYFDDLTRSCTIVMAIVEERRGFRMRNGKCEGTIDEEPLIGNHTTVNKLVDRTDYSYLPNLAAINSKPLERMISYGPLPTNDRCQLSILAERFIDIVCNGQAKEYKPAKSAQAIRLHWEHTMSACSKIREDMSLFYTEDSIESNLTEPEHWYFRIVWDLADILKIVLEHGIMSTATSEFREDAKSRIKQVLGDLETQSQEFLIMPKHIPSKIHTLHGIAGLHAMGMLRESALVVKHTALYLTAAFDRVKVVDKSRASNEATWLASDLKKMTAAAAEAEGIIKSRIKLLNERLNAPGWMDRVEDWTFGDYGTAYDPTKSTKQKVAEGLRKFMPQSSTEEWAVTLTDSWRNNLQGWSMVKFD